MEPKFQSSFIPKGPIVTSSVKSTPSVSVRSVNFLPSLANILFVLALLAWGGLWGYEHLLNSQITADQVALTEAEQTFDPASTHTLVTASERIKAAQGLLRTHVAASNLLSLLQKNILPSVSFTSFNFNTQPNGSLGMSVEGVASSYAVLAEQSKIFQGISNLSNPEFSRLGLSDKGGIIWSFSTDVVSPTISYTTSASQTINTPSVLPAVPVATSTAVATSTKTH